jgi:ssRNA-specific RNase YbeY (16S rRNA maturation enzyme)
MLLVLIIGVGNEINGDCFISVELKITPKILMSHLMKLKRVIVHGLCIIVGYKDKIESEEAIMRLKKMKK